MGVRLTEEEQDAFLTQGHTLILSTVRQSGEPFMTPNWYVWMDGAFFMRTTAKAAKVKHIRRDPRVCCMVEQGERWVDLQAVIASCDADFVDDEALIARFLEAFERKYADFRFDRGAAPEATLKHYGGDWYVIRMTPREGEVRSWYNAKVRFKA
jgi:nitroimidazol reductase NimA-like FMN-containing flavoprotein (pyridoxamine 5'-phosphate oxidase superfamily)